MALRGMKVVEMAGLAPAPFCGMLLSDFGASVIRVDRVNFAGPVVDTLARGKRSIAVNLKTPPGQSVIRQLASQSDVLIEPFRPGVMEKLNLGPDVLLQKNPRLVYARLSGFGQDGAYALAAGHDINYLAISGILSKLGRRGGVPTAPINLLADFAGGGLTCAFGILMSLFERHTSGKGQVVDASMTEGAAYVSSFVFNTQELPIWGKPRGRNLLDSGAPFYDTYETKDGKYMAVGSLEPQFYARLMEGLQLDIPQFSDFESSKLVIKTQFLSKTQEEWVRVFSKLDACVSPVVEMAEAHKDPHNVSRGSFLQNPHTGKWEAAPAPKLSRTPGTVAFNSTMPGEHTIEILKEFGYSEEESLDKIREEFKSDTESGTSITDVAVNPVTQGAQPLNPPPRRHSTSTYRRASQIAIEISLEDMRAQTRGFGGRLLHAVSRFFGRKSRVAQTDSTTSRPTGPTGGKVPEAPTVADSKKSTSKPLPSVSSGSRGVPDGTTGTKPPTKESAVTKGSKQGKDKDGGTSKSKVKDDARKTREVVVNVENEKSVTKSTKPKAGKLKSSGSGEKGKDDKKKPEKKEKVKLEREEKGGRAGTKDDRKERRGKTIEKVPASTKP